MKVFSLGLTICAALAVTTELATPVAAGATICATPDDFADTGSSDAVTTSGSDSSVQTSTSSTGGDNTQTSTSSAGGDNAIQTSTSSTSDDTTTHTSSSGSEGSAVQGTSSSTGSDDAVETSSSTGDDTTTQGSAAQGSSSATGNDGTAAQGSASSTGSDSTAVQGSTGDDTTSQSGDDVTSAPSSVNSSQTGDDADSAVDASSTTSDISSGSDTTQVNGSDDSGSNQATQGDSSEGSSSSVDAGKNGVSTQSNSGDASSSSSSTPFTTGSSTGSTTSSNAGQSVIVDSNISSDAASTTSSASTAGSASNTAQTSVAASGSNADQVSQSSGSNAAQASQSSGSTAAQTSASASTSSEASATSSASTSASGSGSSTPSSSSASSSSGSFTKVTSLQVRVQGDMPEWNADNQRFVSSYYDTFDEKYRAVLDTVNMASVEGALKYVQAECINSSVVTDCERKNSIKYVVFYQTTIVQPTASMEYYANATDEYDFAVEHCPFMAMDGGQCDPNADGSFPDVCNQYSGTDGQPDLGFCVGGTLQDNEAIAPYPHNYWFSFPNSCPQELWDDKTASCREEYAGGMCAVGVEPDGVNCTFSYEILGYILLDDVVGITSMINPLTLDYYADYYEFCEAGGIEFAVSILGDIVSWIVGLPFWANPGDSDANAERVEKLVSAYDTLVATNATTSDGGIMQALPTVDALTALNPPCYDNSPICAAAEFGCKRSYRSQICQVCTSDDSGCEVKP